jgi:RNA polymerase-interacting CarD/CdnL/TRCF family regulator
LPSNHKKRYQILEDKLYAGDIWQVAEAVRDMTWRRQNEGTLTTRGKRMYKEGILLLAGEIAASKGIELTSAEMEVRERLAETTKLESVA